jgi:ABC-type dipeptide/oligopeptide/nickel transport system ATPase component
MCQRVMIAATLAMRPQIIIADEPTTGLDMTSKAQILYLLHEARMQYNSSLIFVTHEIGLATGLTDRIIVMKEGKIVDHFPTNYLADVSLKNSELQIPHDLALHTRELLHASLTLESKTSLHNTL